jgi:RHS repeat-associated protein
LSPGRLTSLHASGAGDWALAYNPTNGLAEAVSPLDGGPGVQYAFDIMDRITDIAWQADEGNTLRGFAMDYDNADMITNVVHATGERRVYTYDSIDRLTGEQHLTASDTIIYSAAYEYDLAGNRTQSVINGVTNTYTLGLGNRLAAWGVNAENAQTYDTAGNVTQITDASGTRNLSWDIQYRLTQVAIDGTPVETYGYDPLGRRSWTSDGSVTTWHIHDGMHVVADVDASGTLLRTYTWGPGIDNLLAITDHSASETNTYYTITDHLGTVHALADDTGAIVESYRFDAWGNILAVYDASNSPLTSDLGHPTSGLGNRFLFQGREYSWATGLYNFRARWYDPVTGRWLSKDPIGINGGLNQYVAFANNPVMFVDPLGLCDEHYTKEDVKAILQSINLGMNSTTRNPLKIVIGFQYHWSMGAHDYKYWTPDATFDVPGYGLMYADQFGNYVAGYSGEISLGSFGAAGVKLGGHVIAALGRDEGDGYIFDSPGSTKYINRGAQDARGYKREAATRLPWWASLLFITLCPLI